jgi:uncharacterized protein (TIGR03435 family)
MRNALIMAFVLVVSGLPAMAQDSPAPGPCAAGTRASFDVVSIKPSQTPSSSSSTRGTPGGLAITSSLRRMILFSYSLHDFQVSGGPDWVSTSTWVVNAKSDTPDPDFTKMSKAELQAMMAKRMQQLQAMLMDRFQLRCHMTAKELPTYELVQAKGGAKLKPTAADVSKQNSSSSSGHGLQMHAAATGITAERIATLLTTEVGRFVVDKTGLTGSYDLTLDWVHDAPAASTDEPSGPTIFTALEEQLGLKLVPSKGPVETFVIDHVEQPSPN